MLSRIPVPAALALGATAGLTIAAQIRINASLGEQLRSVLLAALFSFASGLAFVGVVIASRPATRRAFGRLRESDLRPWMYFGGIVGAAQVTTFTLAVPTIGTALFTVAGVSGQLVGALLVDRTRLAPSGRRPWSGARLAGAGIAVVAVAITQIGKPLGEIAFGLIALATVVNACIAAQLALNGRVNRAAGDPVAAATIHVAVATATLALVVAVSLAGGASYGAPWPGEPWLYAGGVLGVFLVVLFAICARVLDVLRLSLVVTGGQLLGAIAIDAAIPGGVNVSPAVVAGAALTMVAVIVASRPARVEIASPLSLATPPRR